MDFINWPAIIVAALVPMIVGSVWYGPLFGKTWLSSTGKSEEFFKEANMAVTFGLSFVMSLIFSFGLKAIIETTHGGQFGHQDIEGSYHTLKHGAFHGIFMVLIMIMPTFVINSLFERRGSTNLFIHLGYWVVTGAIMGAILDFWI